LICFMCKNSVGSVLVYVVRRGQKVRTEYVR
jgi:hypothetical protein